MKSVSFNVSPQGDVKLVVNGSAVYDAMKIDVTDKDALRDALLSMIDTAYAKLNHRNSAFHLDV
jgi:hypothetical protein